MLGDQLIRGQLTWFDPALLNHMKMATTKQTIPNFSKQLLYFQPKTLKIGIQRFPALCSTVKRTVCSLHRVVDRWAAGSLTRRPKGPFAVSWPRLGNL